VTSTYILFFLGGQCEDSSGYIGPSISFFFADLVKDFHICFVLILLLYNYSLEIENKLQFSSIQFNYPLFKITALYIQVTQRVICLI